MLFDENSFCFFFKQNKKTFCFDPPKWEHFLLSQFKVLPQKWMFLFLGILCGKGLRTISPFDLFLLFLEISVGFFLLGNRMANPASDYMNVGAKERSISRQKDEKQSYHLSQIVYNHFCFLFNFVYL